MHDLLIVYTTYVIAAGSPGPSNMAIMNTAMKHGRGSALALATGVVTMSTCWGFIAATGVSTLLASYANALVVLKVGGGLYLLWLAWRAARSAATLDKMTDDAPSRSPRAWTLYRRGVLMHLGNPKSVLAWVAIMSLGLKPDAALGTVAAAYGGCVLLGVLIFLGYALLFSTAIGRAHV